MKTYIGIVRDHSGSMKFLSHLAARDYNSTIASIQAGAKDNDQDVSVFVVKCGVGHLGKIEKEIVNSNIHILKSIPESSYVADGHNTPLFDSVGELIELMTAMPDASDPAVAFLIIAITDGHENSSVTWRDKLGNRIKQLSSLDRWTFTFRVPYGYAKELSSLLNIPSGNILEWEQTERGIRESTVSNTAAVGNYFVSRASGVRATSSFYSDLSSITKQDLKRNLADITNDVVVWPVSKFSNKAEIRTFVEGINKGQYLKGAAFYQLTKSEKVQPYKQLVIRDKGNGRIYGGHAARTMLNLPPQGDIRLRPGDHGNYDLFVQSTSVNRHVEGNTDIVYWTGAVL